MRQSEDHVRDISTKEILDRLIDLGFARLYETLLDPKVFTKSGKLKITTAARLHGWHSPNAFKTELENARFRMSIDR